MRFSGFRAAYLSAFHAVIVKPVVFRRAALLLWMIPLVPPNRIVSAARETGQNHDSQEEMPEPPAGLWFLLLGWRSIVWLLAAALFLLATATGAACWLSGGPLHHSMRELSNERCE